METIDHTSSPFGSPPSPPLHPSPGEGRTRGGSLLRILHVNDTAGGAGAETWMHGVAGRQLREGHAVELFTASLPPRSPRSLATWWSPGEGHRLGEALEAFRPDVLHIHNFALLSPSILSCACRRVGIVLTLHDFRMESDPHLPGQKRKSASRELLDRVKRFHVRRNILRCGALLHAPSQELSQRTRAWAGDGRVAHIPYGIDVASPSLPVPEDGPLLFSGRVIEEKGIRTLATALGLLPPSVRLQVVGDGPLLPLLRSHPQVEALGWVPRERIQELLARCIGVVQPSEWLENQPLAVLEAQSVGRPVVATRVGGLPELVREGETGLLVDPFDPEGLASALLRLHSDAELRQRLAQGGRLRVERENAASLCDRALLGAYCSRAGMAEAFTGTPPAGSSRRR